MKTLLDEILTREEVIIGTAHGDKCSCKHCCTEKNKAGHQSWRERRAARRASYNSFSNREVDHEFLPVDNILSLGEHRKDLFNFWKNELNKTTDPNQRAKYLRYLRTIATKGKPSWRQSEDDLYYFFYQGIKSPRYLRGNRTAENKKDTVIPDIFSTAMIEVKNYDVNNNKWKLLSTLAKQIRDRRQGLPYDSRQQAIILDLRGQNVTVDKMHQLGQDVSRVTGLAPKDIQILTWEV
ncbi:MAG: hypothetical protein ACOYXT_29735 [Bacteroidota bacterium]